MNAGYRRINRNAYQPTPLATPKAAGVFACPINTQIQVQQEQQQQQQQRESLARAAIPGPGRASP
ncbi:MAG: hypothetical protein GX552_10985 [Chloroflexi bacterium]|jgi:hypothetical protein|nr:hypothetical protein [Chloroflexota bacterium]